ncbi:MAG: urease accessory protein UreD [Acidobacteriota bacterium]|nr:urease accessory protein UreD [Acidobacteriota bacterium]
MDNITQSSLIDVGAFDHGSCHRERLHSPPQTGWQGQLELGFGRRGNQTVLVRNRHRGPLQVQKALYPEGRDICHIAVLHPPGGVAAGDVLCVDASLEDGSRALITTPGATKWYRSEGERAQQQVRVALEGDAILEWLPRENILFDGANVSLELDVDMSAHATYFGWDIFSFGRRASGESWRRGTLRMRTSIRRAGRLIWSEAANVDAQSEFAKSLAGLSGFTVCGTFMIAACDLDAARLSACRDAEPPLAESMVGITRVPGVMIARYLGDSTEDALRWFTRVWAVLRPALLGKAICPPRVWAC